VLAAFTVFYHESGWCDETELDEYLAITSASTIA